MMHSGEIYFAALVWLTNAYLSSSNMPTLSVEQCVNVVSNLRKPWPKYRRAYDSHVIAFETWIFGVTLVFLYCTFFVMWRMENIQKDKETREFRRRQIQMKRSYATKPRPCPRPRPRSPKVTKPHKASRPVLLCLQHVKDLQKLLNLQPIAKSDFSF